jgi:hypothetical protein
MKLFTKNEVKGPVTAKAGEMQTSTSSYNVENYAVAILTLLTGIATALGTYIGNIPKQESDKSLFELKTKYFNILMLQRVLTDSNAIERSKSMNLLIASGIINDRAGRIKDLIDSCNVPKWNAQTNDRIDLIFSGSPNAGEPSSTTTLPSTGTQPGTDKTPGTGTKPGSTGPTM